MNVRGYHSPPPDYLEYDGFETPRQYLGDQPKQSRHELDNFAFPSTSAPADVVRKPKVLPASLPKTSFNERFNHAIHPESPKLPKHFAYDDYYSHNHNNVQLPQIGHQSQSAPTPTAAVYEQQPEDPYHSVRKYEELLNHKQRPGDPFIDREAERTRKNQSLLTFPLPKIRLSTKPPKYDEFGRLMEVTDRYALKPVKPYSDALDLGSGPIYDNKHGVRFIPTYKRYSDNNAPLFPRLL